MGPRLRDEIRTCLRKAEEARTRAQMSSSPDEQQHFQSLEAMWSALAKSTHSADSSKVYRSSKAKTRGGAG